MPENPERPGRLPLPGQVIVVGLLAAGFVSGVLVWWGQTVGAGQETPLWWLRPTLVLHGCLFPMQCVLFGILLCHHIRAGWALRANVASGFCAEVIFAGLIATGSGLYYVGSEEWRSRILWTHRILGLSLPLVLAWHWWSGLRWVRRVDGKQPSGWGGRP